MVTRARSRACPSVRMMSCIWPRVSRVSSPTRLACSGWKGWPSIEWRSTRRVAGSFMWSLHRSGPQRARRVGCCRRRRRAGSLRLVWHKRRWRCGEALCARATFTEHVTGVPARARLTRRLRTELGHAVAEQRRCVSDAAEHYGVGWATVHAAYITHVDGPLALPLPVVVVLGIDETRRGKPVWAQDRVTRRWVLVCDRWHTGFVDAAGTGGLLGQVEGRSAATVTSWLTKQPPAWRKTVTHVTID